MSEKEHFKSQRRIQMTSTVQCFQKLGISPSVISKLNKLNIQKPSLTQMQFLPRLLNIDYSTPSTTVLHARSGSGKTLSYLLGMGNSVKTALVVVPNSHLAEQVQKMASPLNFSCSILQPGIKYRNTFKTPSNEDSTTLIIATPSVLSFQERISDIVQPMDLVIVDEADSFLAAHERTCQALFYSLRHKSSLFVGATMARNGSKTIGGTLQTCFKNIQWLVMPDSHSIASNMKNEFYPVSDLSQVASAISKLIENRFNEKKVLIFCKSTQEALDMKEHLNSSIGKERFIGILHASMKKDEQRKALRDFNREAPQIMIATDLGARGLDFVNVDVVIQASFATDSMTVIHRLGRAGRGIPDSQQEYTGIHFYDETNDFAIQVKELIEQNKSLEETFSRRRLWRKKVKKNSKGDISLQNQ